MMNPRIKKRWVATLRSGKYAQTKRFLHVIKGTSRIKPGYCCLGLLCMIAPDHILGPTEVARITKRRHTPTLWTKIKPITVESQIGVDVWPDGLPNHKILTWAGLSQNNVTFLSILNDNLGWSFTQIADWIEKHL